MQHIDWSFVLHMMLLAYRKAFTPSRDHPYKIPTRFNMVCSPRLKVCVASPDTLWTASPAGDSRSSGIQMLASALDKAPGSEILQR